MKILRLPKYALDIWDTKRRPSLKNQAKKRVEENPGLREALQAYTKKAKASGASYADYWMLYKYIRIHKPQEILECGTGVTTVVMAQALHENAQEGLPAGKPGTRGRITSMEELETYHQNAISCFPEHLKKYVDFIYSPKVEDYYHLFRGVRYRDVPMDRPYEFVFIDGPQTDAPSDGQKTFDFDFIRVLERAKNPVFALVDTRMSTCFALKCVLKEGKVVFDYANEVGIIGPCTKTDLRSDWNGITVGLGPRPIKSGKVKNFLRYGFTNI